MFKLRTQGLLVASVTLLFVSCSATQAVNKPDESTSVKLSPSYETLTTHTPTDSNIAEQSLSLQQIMADPDWMGRQPIRPYWADDSAGVYYEQKRLGSPLRDLWIKDLGDETNGKKVNISTKHQDAYQRRVLDQHNKMAAWVFEGNVFIKDLETKTLKQLTKDNKKPYNLKFLNDGRLSFQSGDSFYAIDPFTGFYELLVTWSFADEPIGVTAPQDYIAEQQQKLIKVVALKRNHQEQKFQQQSLLEKTNSSLAPPSFYFAKGNETVEASLSPNGKWLIVAETKHSEWRDDGDIMPNYINEDGRISADKVRPRVADVTPKNEKLWLLNIEKHTKRALSYSDLPGFNEDVLASVKRENAAAKGQEYSINRLPRDIVLLRDWSWSQSAIQWHSDGDNVAIMLEAWDNKDRWLTSVDLATAKLKNQHRLHDDAWVNYDFNSFGWLHKSKALYYLSEESGYANLYLKPLNGEARALVSGQFEVNNLTLSQDDSFMYFKANKKHPGIYEIYRVAIQSLAVQELTNLNGMTDYQLSPDEQSLLLTHSTLTRPPELYVKNIGDENAKQITHTISQAFLDIDWIAPDIVPIPSSHTEQPIFSRVYAPKNANYEFDEKRKAVVFSHGAGYLQNAHLGWSAYFREYMFHNMLAQQGYVVLDMDYRASAGYGRDWRTAIYRQMGTPEIQDLQDGVNWLAENQHVDANRVGTYGGSYGGFMTFMAMFKSPELFKAGAALRPVSDWAHYNHGYTSNILNTPDIDPIAYERSSPIYFAEGLQKPLLINAPMVDSNVFFVDVVRLVQRFIELEKQNFETAIYPVESHGFVQPSSWLDEYRRIYKLFETNL
ncbi:prolyl oligopeptidase family serine peptidase [Paraglaciecola sp. 2405UD69-4]|uniref:S9 family peptidase n=1 Tax=Paraglaciecola sp. 2405UD69-4 TaxID=3391836 RepID=UPI0039C95701